MACSDLWGMRQWKCKNGKKEVSIVALLAMKSLLVGTGRYLCKAYNYLDSRAYGYSRSAILLRLVVLRWEWNCFDLACVELYDL
jgi:hypothetical protein